MGGWEDSFTVASDGCWCQNGEVPLSRGLKTPEGLWAEVVGYRAGEKTVNAVVRSIQVG